MKRQQGSSQPPQIILDQIIYDLQRCGGISVRWTALTQRLQQEGVPIGVVPARTTENVFYHQSAAWPVFGDGPQATPLLVRRLSPVFGGLPSGAVFHSSYYRTCLQRDVHNVVTVHDFVNERYNQGLKARLHTAQKFWSIKKAAHVICVSESTKNDLMGYFPDFDQKRISVIYNAPEAIFRPLAPGETPQGTEVVADVLGNLGAFAVFVGSRAAYKRFPMAVEVMAKLPKLNLLIVGGGSLSAEEQSILANKLPGRWQALGYTTGEELNLIYNRCRFLLHTSEYEGFGIPIVEAQNAGAIAICAPNSSMPEVQCWDALMVKDDSATGFAAIATRLEDAGFRAQAQAAGRDHGQRFSWAGSHQQEMRVYQSLLQAKAIAQ